MLLKIYSILRFLITTFLLVALAWQGFSLLQNYQTRALENLTSVGELTRALKDCQIYLEKYRLFEQKVLLDDVAKNCAIAEAKLNVFARRGLTDTRKVVTPTIFAVIDSIRGSIKIQKEIINNLTAIHQEEDLSKAALSTISGFRTELEKAVNLTIALGRLTLTAFEESNTEILRRVKIDWLRVLILILVLYIFELIFIFKALKRKNLITLPTQFSTSPEITDSLQTEVSPSQPNLDKQCEELLATQQRSKTPLEDSAPTELEERFNLNEHKETAIVAHDVQSVLSAKETESTIPTEKPQLRVEEKIKPKQVVDFSLLQSNFRKVEEVIDDLAERISLMSFNALLEATRAGETGSGFQVIAEELRKLADRSTKQKSLVKKLLEEIFNKLSNVKSAQS